MVYPSEMSLTGRTARAVSHIAAHHEVINNVNDNLMDKLLYHMHG